MGHRLALEVSTAIIAKMAVPSYAKWSIAGVLAVFALTSLAYGEQIGGYLTPDAVDILAVLLPAPTIDDSRYKTDREVFLQTRSWAGTPRWNLAINDVKTTTADMMRDFSCAAGVELTPADAPQLAALAEKARIDTERATNVAKDHYKRLRPFQIDKGQICQPESELANSFDYPSGHTTLGWTWAFILADLIPSRTAAIVARARAFGESRIVCGAHNASAVEAGLLSVQTTMPMVKATPSYRADLEAARTELRGLQQSANVPEPQQCVAEEKLERLNIFGPVLQ